MHESALHSSKQGWSIPEVREARVTEELLEQDKARLSRTYGEPVTSRFQPLRIDSARYNVKLPSTPQHQKYTLKSVSPEVILAATDRGESSSSSSKPGGGRKTLVNLLSDRHRQDRHRQKVGQRVAYNIKRLEDWFGIMDTDGSGEITMRKLMIGMMKRQDLYDMLQILKDGGQTDIKDMKLHARPKAGQLTKEDIDWIQGLIDDLDQDGDHIMEWPEFVDFFRRTGLLLEYSTREDLNKSHLGETDIEVCRKKLEADRIEQESKFFDANRRGGKRQEKRAARRASRLDNPSDCLQAQTT